MPLPARQLSLSFKRKETCQQGEIMSLDRDKSIIAQAILKGLWGGLSHSLADTPTFVTERVEAYFKFSCKLIETYAKLEEPLERPLNAPGTHLGNEKVAIVTPLPYAGLQPIKQEPSKNNWPKPIEGRKFTFASEKQANRAYAIWKGAGWSDQDARTFLFDRWGISNPKRIPVEVYEEVCQVLNDGPVE